MVRNLVFLVVVVSASSECNWTSHRPEPQVHHLEIAEGADVEMSIGTFCSRLALDDVGCGSVLSGVRGRHRSVGATAPYRMTLEVQLPARCGRVQINDYELVYDANDDFRDLAQRTCTGLGLSEPCPASLEAALMKRPGECPAARSRRMAQGHVCAGPWTTKVGGSSRVDCVDFPFGGVSCRFENLYLRDGKWYLLSFEEELPVLRLGTRVDAPILELKTKGVPTEVLALPEDRIHFLAARFEPGGRGEGHGHLLHDVALPMFWALNQLNASMMIQTVFLDGHLRAPADEWLAAVTPRPPIYTHELDFLCPAHAWCVVPHAVAGLENRSYFALDLGRQADDAVLTAFGAVHAAFAAAAGPALLSDPAICSSEKRVAIVQRLHSRVLTNADAIADALCGEQWTVAIHVLDFETPAAQINLFRSADLVVAVEGGALDLLLVAPPGAVIVIGRNPALPWPDGCSGCDSHEQFTHGHMLDAAVSWLPSARIPCCNGLPEYTPDVDAILEAARDLLRRPRPRPSRCSQMPEEDL